MIMLHYINLLRLIVINEFTPHLTEMVKMLSL